MARVGTFSNACEIYLRSNPTEIRREYAQSSNLYCSTILQRNLRLPFKTDFAEIEQSHQEHQSDAQNFL